MKNKSDYLDDFLAELQDAIDDCNKRANGIHSTQTDIIDAFELLLEDLKDSYEKIFKVYDDKSISWGSDWERNDK